MGPWSNSPAGSAHLDCLGRMTRGSHRAPTWSIPAWYAGLALIAALCLPRLEARFGLPLETGVDPASLLAMFSSVASGMIALTGIVFSLTFVMVQFSATAYSPRLVLWIARDPVMSHALGSFTATFLYGICAIAGVDRSGNGHVPYVSVWVELALLLASVAMFVAIIQRIGLLQINRMLIFTGDQGRKVIDHIYPASRPEVTPSETDNFRSLTRSQTLVYHGGPRAIQTVNVDALVTLAKRSDGIIEMVVAVGDTVSKLTPLLHVFGPRQHISERNLEKAIELGNERTFAQDPKYALRLLVDIGIKALSPAINDPTTAVQSLDQIEDLLLRIGQRDLEVGKYRDSDGKLRLVVPFPSWDDLLRLAFDEIRYYGGTSVQVMRRMNALVADLSRALPEERRPALAYWDERLKGTIARSFSDSEERLDASKEDRQGLGIPREHAANERTITGAQ